MISRYTLHVLTIGICIARRPGPTPKEKGVRDKVVPPVLQYKMFIILWVGGWIRAWLSYIQNTVFCIIIITCICIPSPCTPEIWKLT